MSKTDQQKSGSSAKASDHANYGTSTLVSILIPFVGFIMGAMYLTKEKLVDRKLGEHLIACGVLSLILGGAAWYALAPSLYSPTSTIMSTPIVTQPVQQAPTWDIDAKYALVSNGQTKAQVQDALGKAPANCSETVQSGSADKYASCTYGGTQADGGIIIVNYVNDIVTTKEKSTF